MNSEAEDKVCHQGPLYGERRNQFLRVGAGGDQRTEMCYLSLFRTEPQKKSFGRGSITAVDSEIVCFVIDRVVAFWALVGIFWLPRLSSLVSSNQRGCSARSVRSLSGWQLGRKWRRSFALPSADEPTERMPSIFAFDSRSSPASELHLQQAGRHEHLRKRRRRPRRHREPITRRVCWWIGTMKAPYAPYSNTPTCCRQRT